MTILTRADQYETEADDARVDQLFAAVLGGEPTIHAALASGWSARPSVDEVEGLLDDAEEALDDQWSLVARFPGAYMEHGTDKLCDVAEAIKSARVTLAIAAAPRVAVSGVAA